MELLGSIWDFCSGPYGAAVGFGLWVISEALASIPAVKANSVFQAIRQALSRFKNRTPVTLLAIIMVTALMAGCGKTLDQIRHTAYSAVDVAFKFYEDVKDNANTAKELVQPAPKE